MVNTKQSPSEKMRIVFYPLKKNLGGPENIPFLKEHYQSNINFLPKTID